MLCVHAGVSAIDVLHANLRSALRLFSSNAVFVTLLAATVVVAASLVPELSVNLEDGSRPFGEAISKSFEILDEHRWQVEGAPRAMEQLEKFLKTVKSEQRRRTACEFCYLFVFFFLLFKSLIHPNRITPWSWSFS